MKLRIYLLIVFLPFQGKVFPQVVTLDSIQIERVAKTGQLWGHLKYFHPYLSDPGIDWERAFTDHIEEVIEAENNDDYAIAVQKMLARLNDPVTKVIQEVEPKVIQDTLKYPIIKFLEDNILLVAVRDYSDLLDRNYVVSKFMGLKGKLLQSKGVLFDIRSQADPGELRGILSSYFSAFENSLVSSDIFFPGFMARFHDGFVPEVGGTSGGYSSGHYTKGEKRISPDPVGLDVPVVFLVSEHSEIPRVALALQKAGQATIISTNSLTDAPLITPYKYKLNESIEVNIRLHQLPTGYKFKEDFLIPPDTKEEEILKLAMKVIKGITMPQTTKRVNVEFHEEKVKDEIPKSSRGYYPDLPHRLLAAAKIWTVIHYFFAYQDLMEKDWDQILREYIPRIAMAADSLEFNLAIAEMFTNIQDGHGSIRSDVLSDYFGQSYPPVKIRYIEDKPVVVGLLSNTNTQVKGIEIGDIIMEVNGEVVKDKFDRYARYIPASNSSWLKGTIARKLLTGHDGIELALQLKGKDGMIKSITVPVSIQYRHKIRRLGNGRSQTPVTRLINEDIGYADLDRLERDQVGKMFMDFINTKAIIFDMRGYPNGTAWAIAPHLTNKENVYAANFRRYAPMGINFGQSKHMTFFNQAIPPPRLPTYKGKTIMLIDERTMSQAEHTGLFFEAANSTKFVGSQTAGANGDVTNFRIPGNITLQFSGHDVRHADGRQLQKIGLIPDVPVKPTIEGIRAGKDEVLDRAIEYTHELIRQD